VSTVFNSVQQFFVLLFCLLIFDFPGKYKEKIRPLIECVKARVELLQGFIFAGKLVQKAKFLLKISIMYIPCLN
jgi:hypothetical protein